MIELEFRAWDGAHMFYNVIVGNGTWSDCDGEYWFADEPICIMQYTGKKDKYNRKIYKDDYLQNDSGRICQVYWNDICGCWDAKVIKTKKDDNPLCFEFTKWNRLEIIGNKYRNPELNIKE